MGIPPLPLPQFTQENILKTISEESLAKASGSFFNAENKWERREKRRKGAKMEPNGEEMRRIDMKRAASDQPAFAQRKRTETVC